MVLLEKVDEHCNERWPPRPSHFGHDNRRRRQPTLSPSLWSTPVNVLDKIITKEQHQLTSCGETSQVNFRIVFNTWQDEKFTW